jgi:hypothetical protein
MRIFIRDLFDPGSGMEKFGSEIRRKHPGSATSGVRGKLLQPMAWQYSMHELTPGNIHSL